MGCRGLGIIRTSLPQARGWSSKCSVRDYHQCPSGSARRSSLERASEGASHWLSESLRQHEMLWWRCVSGLTSHPFRRQRPANQQQSTNSSLLALLGLRTRDRQWQHETWPLTTHSSSAGSIGGRSRLPHASEAPSEVASAQILIAVTMGLIPVILDR